MSKPIKPNITIPSGFAINGTKTDFLQEQIEQGFDPVDPDVLAGDNLNKFIDDTYKGLNYSIAGVSDLYKGAVLYDENETYNDKSIVFNIEDNGKVSIFLSLVNNNTGNSLSNTSKWQEISSLSMDKINQSKALTTGNISNDADVYSTILERAHSTFNLSKFELVGTPTISDDGVASGFSAANYLTIANLASAPQDSLIISMKFTPVQNTTDDRYQCLFAICTDDLSKRIYLYVNTTGTSVILNVNGTTITTGAVNTNSINTAKVVWNKVDNIQGKFSLYVNDDLIGAQEFNTSDIIFTNNFNIGFLGLSANTTNYGSIDLKSVAIWSDGVPVFNGNETGTDTYIIDGEEVEIPYTLSKTGSKIADAAYRDRVQDLYEQTGEALYYTIDEENQNFTLPMADIYGMIENSRKGAMPVGTIFAHTCAADFVPENSLPCDGSEYTSSQFSSLYTNWLVDGKLNTCTYTEYQSDITAYGKCAKFGLDTTNQKFKVPTIPDGTIIQQAMSDDELGKSYNAGLPNIEGSHGGLEGSTFYTSGAFSIKDTTQRAGGSSGSGDCYVSFDASLSNSTYGNSDTVQPEAVALRYFVVVATGAISQSAMDWSQWATGLQGKLNTDHSNDTKPYITETYVNETSGYLVYSNGYCEQWGQVTTTNTSYTLSFIKSFSNLNYIMSGAMINASYNKDNTANLAFNKTSTSGCEVYGSINKSGFYWQARGYIS